MHFLIPGVAIADCPRLSQIPDSIYFLNKRYFSLFIFEVDFVFQRSKIINVCLLFLELKLNPKGGTANEKTHFSCLLNSYRKIKE